MGSTGAVVVWDDVNLNKTSAVLKFIAKGWMVQKRLCVVRRRCDSWYIDDGRGSCVAMVAIALFMLIAVVCRIGCTVGLIVVRECGCTIGSSQFSTFRGGVVIVSNVFALEDNAIGRRY